MSGLSLYGSGLTITEAQGPNYYLGTWNASTNTPTLASSTAPAGPAGSYYIVSVAGTTTLNGISDWTVGDWAIWNGSVWQKLEGGATAITVGSTAIAGGTTGRVLYDNAGTLGEYTITGTAGNVVMSVSPTLTGQLSLAQGSVGTPSRTWTGTSLGEFASTGSIYYTSGSVRSHRFYSGGSVTLTAGGQYTWSSTSDADGTSDLILSRDAANTLAQRNGTNAQTFRIYNTYTDASNYERGNLVWSGNTLSLITTNAGTGAARDVVIGSGSAPGASPGGTNVTVAQSGVSVQRDGTSNSTQFTVGGTGLTSTTQLHTRLTPTINQASGTYTVLDINPTETAIGAGPHYLITGRIGAGANVFSVTNGGAVTALNVTSTGSTWANIPAAGTAGRMQFVSNAGTKGSMWLDDGTRWKPTNGSAVLATLDAASANIANTETIVFQYLIPAGMWQTGDTLRVQFQPVKSGTTDQGIVYIHCGTAGTTSDTTLLSSTWLTAGNRYASYFVDYRLDSATSVAQTTTNIGFGATTVTPPSFTISSASANALYISVGIASSGTTDTIYGRSGMIQLISKAN